MGGQPYSKAVAERRCQESIVTQLQFDAILLCVVSTRFQDTGLDEYRGYTRAPVLALPWMDYLEWDGR